MKEASMNRRGLKLMALAVLFVSLAIPQVFAGGEQEAGPVTINFLADNRTELVRMQELLPEFEAQTGIKVNWIQMQETPLRSKTGLELSAPSTEIDVIMTDFLFMNKYANAGYLHAIDDYLEASGTFKESDFQPPFLDAAKYKGKIYAVPLYQDCNILAYRADLYAKFGLNVPVTFDDLEHVAKVIDENEPGVAGITLRGQRGMGVNEWTWPTFLRGFGGSYYDENMMGNLDTPEAIAALEYYNRILMNYGPEGVANFSYIEVMQGLMQGTAAMWIDSASLGPRSEDPSASKVAGKLGYAVVPGNVERQPGFYSWMLVVPAHSKRKEAAGKFVAWIISPDIAIKLGWSAPNQALEAVYDIPPYAGYSQSEPLVKVMKDSLALADPDYRPRVPEQAEVGTVVSIAISEVLSGEKSATEALKSASAEITRIMKEAGYPK